MGRTTAEWDLTRDQRLFSRGEGGIIHEHGDLALAFDAMPYPSSDSRPETADAGLRHRTFVVEGPLMGWRIG
jgi:hypothetical protein